MTTRRRFLLNSALALTAAPFAAAVWSPALQAQALPPLPADHATAKALGYVDDASKTTHASFKPGSACNNCQFFTAATGACSLFPGYSVSAKGWCSAWAKKA